MVDLDARTLDTLDWATLLARLAHHARTPRGAEAALSLALAADRAEVVARYDAVDELIEVEADERLLVGRVPELRDPLGRAAMGRPLDARELMLVGQGLRALADLHAQLTRLAERAPALHALAAPISVDPELLRRLEESFDEKGELSEHTYPELGELRRAIRALGERVRATLERMLKDEAMASVLQDRYVTQRGDRWVLPVKAEAKRAGLGIVHDSSGSGETVFIEPAEVVELNNDLRLAEARLEREVARILVALSRMVGRFAEPIEASLAAAAAVDLACARAGLGQELRGLRPRVGEEGVLHLVEARHPVLQLRGVAVVPNDLSLDPQRPGMVLSGPNTGGKTVALKTLGLAALLVRAGVPVPAAEGSRVDVFPDIIADIGDLQTVSGDLSTFSGHLLVLREVLGRARPGALVLLDEIAVGTDPAQGAALARAALEALVEAGARVAVTTHYNDLKAFASVDPRFVNAAVHLADGRPAYRVQRDSVGLSHAFATARRLGLDPALVARAEALLSEDARAVGHLLEQLSAERQEVLALREALAAEREALAARRRELDARLERVRGRTEELARERAEASRARLARLEDEARGLVAALQADPSLKQAGLTLARVRELSERARPEAPPPARVEAPPPRALAPGDAVRVASLGGKAAVVLSPPRKGQVEVEVGGLRTRVKLTDLRLRSGEPVPAPPPAPPVRVEPPPQALAGVRVGANTLDLRGRRVDEAIEATERFIDGLVVSGQSVGFLLHGHGTGALKQALRQWLPGAGRVRDWRPANEDEGGDAFTLIGV